MIYTCMKLKLSISPCPNDTFMFDAMINGRIDTEGLKFYVTFADIENLNKALLSGPSPDISKASYAVYPHLQDKYIVLNSGSALGKGNGPLLVAADPDTDITDYSMRVAIPGVNTTANLLLERLYPHLTLKRPYIFSEIMHAVGSGACDAGVLIHEGRFVYHHHGLYLLSDLGLEWERRTGLPLPLGAIVVSRSLPEETRRTVERVLRRSIEYAFANPDASAAFVKSHVQEMDDDVIKSHIALFVNDHSLNIGDTGRKAVQTLLALPNSPFQNA